MSVIKNSIFIIYMCIIWYTTAQDVSVSINTKKALHIVDERFISIVVDPLVIMSGLNISSQTTTLARHLSPAFVRIQGISSPEIRFSDHVEDERQATDRPEFGRVNLTVTPSMWTSLNGWLISANLTPVFALSDRDRINDAWNPKSAALPLMTIADKMNVTCYWELNNDSPNKSLKQYSDDLTTLRHILDAFPTSRNSWGVVGGEWGQNSFAPMPNEPVEVTRKLLKNIENTVDAIVWAPILNSKAQYPDRVTKGISVPNTKKSAIWTTAPRTTKPKSFGDALTWAKYLGLAANRGYDAIFRQPKVKEMFELTPAYWVTYFHKQLMGTHVLDIRTLHHRNKDCEIFSHCSKCTKSEDLNGGLVIFVINNGSSPVNFTTKLLGMTFKSLEVQPYIFTSTNEDSSEIYVNGNLLTISDLQNEVVSTACKVHKIVSTKSLTLNVPEKSIGFFVLPNTNLAACSNKENPHNLVDETSNNTPSEVTNIDKEEAIVSAMNELYEMLKEEMSSSEDYYKFDRNDSIKEKSNDENVQGNVRKIILQRAKQLAREKTDHKSAKFQHLLAERARNEQKKQKLLDEMEKIKASTEVEQAIDDVINNNADDIKSRRKRQTIEFISRDGYAPTEVDKIEARIALDPVANEKHSEEQSCLCQNKGKCTCGMRNANELLQGIMNMLGKQSIFQRKIPSNEEKSDRKKMALEEFAKITSFVNNVKDMFLSGKPTGNHQPENKKKIDPNTNDQLLEPEIIMTNFIPKLDADDKHSDEIMEKITVRKMRSPNKTDEQSIQKRLKDLENNHIKNSFAAIKLIEGTKNMNRYEKRKVLKEQLETYEHMEKLLEHQLQKARRDIMTIQIELEDSPPKHLTKRSFWDINDSMERTTTQFMDKNSLELDQTKESDTFMNEISKERNNNYMKDIEEDIYKMKPILITTKLNSITEETPVPEDYQTTSPISEPVVTWSESTTNIPGSFDEDSDVISETDEAGLVDNVFKKLISFLSGFHKKIVSYMQLITS